jgi:hypothetical protein
MLNAYETPRFIGAQLGRPAGDGSWQSAQRQQQQQEDIKRCVTAVHGSSSSNMSNANEQG